LFCKDKKLIRIKFNSLIHYFQLNNEKIIVLLDTGSGLQNIILVLNVVTIVLRGLFKINGKMRMSSLNSFNRIDLMYKGMLALLLN
jgi:hypothetical protein